jgi:hypothetical protein
MDDDDPMVAELLTELELLGFEDEDDEDPAIW